MPRRHYLVSYDIADDKRRTRIARLLEGEGDRVQYSVFFCECSPTERAHLCMKIDAIIHNKQDQVLLLDLGPADNPLDRALHVMGKPYEPHVRTLVV